IEFLVIHYSVCSGLFSSVQNANSHWFHCILEVNLLGTHLYIVGGGEYNIKDSDLIHALEPCPISSFSVRVSFVCSRFSSPEICTNSN
ncbi:hypothetical protein Goshw_029681, partial [Gossypium schwendimanii]|nr:hypothetical protein [Gossypium schwendimanii]